MSGDQSPRAKLDGWGARLPARGKHVAHLLSSIANVTLPKTQRMGDAETLGDLLGLSPHFAWRLACDTAIALGFGPSGAVVWRQIVYDNLPGGQWPSAEQWLETAGLDTDGRSRDQQQRAAWPTDDDWRVGA